MDNEQKGTATTNAILVILLVVIVALGVWMVTTRSTGTTETTDNTSGGSLQIDLRGDGTPEDNSN